MINGDLPALVNLKSYVTVSPGFILPKSWVSFSNFMTGPSVPVPVVLAVVPLFEWQAEKRIPAIAKLKNRVFIVILLLVLCLFCLFYFHFLVQSKSCPIYR